MPNKLKIYLDDKRDPENEEKYKGGGWSLVKTAAECIELLKKGGVTALSLDHDLGEFDKDGNEKTGYDVIKWIEEEVFTNKNYLPPEEMEIHSANPSGRERINASKNHIDKMMAER